MQKRISFLCVNHKSGQLNSRLFLRKIKVFKLETTASLVVFTPLHVGLGVIYPLTHYKEFLVTTCVVSRLNQELIRV